MKPKFISEKRIYSELYETLSRLNNFTLNQESLRAEGYLTEVPVDSMNWDHLFSIIAYIRLNKRSLNSGWCIYFELYEDSKINLNHFLDTYETSPFCDCSHVSNVFEFFEIDEGQKEKYGNQWSILGAEDHVVFSKDLSWFLITDCTVGKSTIYYQPENKDIIQIWKKEFSFEKLEDTFS